jgi:hypothetical protein
MAASVKINIELVKVYPFAKYKGIEIRSPIIKIQFSTFLLAISHIT